MLQDNLLNPRPAWLVAAFQALAWHQFLTAAQVALRLHEALPEVAPVLQALVVEGLLRELTPSHSLVGSPPAPAYALTRRGVELLRQTGYDAPVSLPHPMKSLYILAHELARNDFALTLEELDARRCIRLHRWETRRTHLGDVAQVNDHGHPIQIPLVADGLAVVEVEGVVTGLLLEQDQGTVSLERMSHKFQGYAAWWASNGPVRRFGLKSLRVVTVVPSEARLQRLRTAALDATNQRGSRLFWFARQEDIHPDRLLGPVWQAAEHDDHRLHLFADAHARTA